jgi:hypothetical protein
METVFRFLMSRPPERTTMDSAVVVMPSQRLAAALGPDALTSGQVRERLRRLVEADGPGTTWTNDPVVTKLLRVSAQLYADAAPAGPDVSKLVGEALGRTPKDLLDDTDYHSARAQVGDGLIVGKLLGAQVEPRLLDLWRLVHVFDLVDRAARGMLDKADPAQVDALRHRVVVLDALPARPPVRGDAPPGAAGGTAGTGTGPGNGAATGPLDPARLRAARDQLLGLPADALADSPNAGRSVEVPVDVSVPAPPAVAAPPGSAVTAGVPAGQVVAAGLPAGSVAVSPDPAPAAGAGTPPVPPRTPAIVLPPASRAARTRLRQQAVQGLTQQTTETLRAAGLDLADLTLVGAVTALTDRLRQSTAGGPDGSAAMFVQVGNRLRSLQETAGAGWSPNGTGASASQGSVSAVQHAVVPSTHATLAPVGVGDLLVVRQHLTRYEAVDLSYVENILPSEQRSREHRRAQTTETTVTVETERTKQDERDQQSTERYELQSEADAVIKADASLKAGVSVTQFGPFQEFKANADVALSASRQESTKVATQYGKEVTTRATTKLSERVREQRTVKTTEVYEEVNKHGFDNTAADARAVIGQYQFLNKVYQAQVYNYGKRLLFDFMVPEPAAYLTALAATPGPNPDLTRPEPFTLRPDEIDDVNYTRYVQQYQVPGVEPPPKLFTTLTPQPFEGTRDNKDKPDLTKTAVLALPDGYVALQAHLVGHVDFLPGGEIGPAQVWVMVGSAIETFDPLSPLEAVDVGMHTEHDSLPVSVMTTGRVLASFVVNVEVTCMVTARAMDAWRLKTHAAISAAYQQQLRDYEAKLAAFQAQQLAQAHGTNPDANRAVERAELRRQTISVLTAQYFDDFGAFTTDQGGPPDKYGVPDVDFAAAEAQGSYARFFEQAFEWEQMMYFLYPYYWAAKSRWRTLARAGDDDPLFEQFLKSGFARVVVSVRPGFELAVTHFLETGQIWAGGDLPPVTSPMYLNIVDEVRAAQHAPGSEVPQGDPWQVVVPTALVMLRSSADLPSWVQHNDGTWQAR